MTYPFIPGLQHDKIVKLCDDGEFHCQAAFWPISKSPHKRRAEIEERLKVRFETRKCEHGIMNAFDYRMIGFTPAPQTTFVPVYDLKTGTQIGVREVRVAGTKDYCFGEPCKHDGSTRCALKEGALPSRI